MQSGIYGKGGNVPEYDPNDPNDPNNAPSKDTRSASKKPAMRKKAEKPTKEEKPKKEYTGWFGGVAKAFDDVVTAKLPDLSGAVAKAAGKGISDGAKSAAETASKLIDEKAQDLSKIAAQGIEEGLAGGAKKAAENILPQFKEAAQDAVKSVGAEAKSVISESIPAVKDAFEEAADNASHRIVLGLCGAAAIMVAPQLLALGGVAAPQLLALGGVAATTGGLAALGLGLFSMGKAVFTPRKKDTLAKEKETQDGQTQTNSPQPKQDAGLQTDATQTESKGSDTQIGGKTNDNETDSDVFHDAVEALDGDAEADTHKTQSTSVDGQSPVSLKLDVKDNGVSVSLNVKEHEENNTDQGKLESPEAEEDVFHDVEEPSSTDRSPSGRRRSVHVMGSNEDKNAQKADVEAEVASDTTEAPHEKAPVQRTWMEFFMGKKTDNKEKDEKALDDYGFGS